MGMLEQLEGQLRFVQRCSSDYQAAEAEDFGVGLPHNHRRHHAVSVLGINNSCDDRSIVLYCRKAQPTLSHEVPVPGRVVNRPRPKMQTLCFQFETCT